MDVDTMLLFISAAMFKLGVYVFWKVNKRLEKLEYKTKSIKNAILNLHREEFKELHDALRQININIIENEKKSLGIDIVDEEALKLHEEFWLNGNNNDKASKEV